MFSPWVESGDSSKHEKERSGTSSPRTLWNAANEANCSHGCLLAKHQ